VTQAVIDLLSTPWSYAVILGIAALDALVPGGRTATTFTTGTVRYKAALFFAAAAGAAVAWACYAVLLGYYGGRVFEERPFLALGVALAIAFGVTAAVELTRKLRRRPNE
jgi:membrane-associated protein